MRQMFEGILKTLVEKLVVGGILELHHQIILVMYRRLDLSLIGNFLQAIDLLSYF